MVQMSLEVYMAFFKAKRKSYDPSSGQRISSLCVDRENNVTVSPPYRWNGLS